MPRLTFEQGNSLTFVNNKQDEPLGTIAYYSRWRMHVYAQHEGVVMSWDCLQEVVDKMQAMDKERKEKRNAHKLTKASRDVGEKTILLNSDDIVSVTAYFEPAFCNGSYIIMRGGAYVHVHENPECVLELVTKAGAK